MPRTLKVFRTSIGFHDAYVATTSQKAALEAWGAKVNLFTRGMAEEVTEAAATREPLSRPGEVIRKVRGTMADHLAALPREPAQSAGKGSSRGDNPAKAAASGRKASPLPPPSRAKLDAATEALSQAERSYAEQKRVLDEREADIRRARRALDDTYLKKIEQLEASRSTVEADYRKAIAQWKEAGR